MRYHEPLNPQSHDLITSSAHSPKQSHARTVFCVGHGVLDFGADWCGGARYANDGIYSALCLFLGKKFASVLCMAVGAPYLWTDDC